MGLNSWGEWESEKHFPAKSPREQKPSKAADAEHGLKNEQQPSTDDLLGPISNKCFRVPFMPKLPSSNTSKEKLWLAGAEWGNTNGRSGHFHVSLEAGRVSRSAGGGAGSSRLKASPGPAWGLPRGAPSLQGGGREQRGQGARRTSGRHLQQL